MKQRFEIEHGDDFDPISEDELKLILMASFDIGFNFTVTELPEPEQDKCVWTLDKSEIAWDRYVSSCGSYIFANKNFNIKKDSCPKCFRPIEVRKTKAEGN